MIYWKIGVLYLIPLLRFCKPAIFLTPFGETCGTTIRLVIPRTFARMVDRTLEVQSTFVQGNDSGPVVRRGVRERRPDRRGDSKWPQRGNLSCNGEAQVTYGAVKPSLVVSIGGETKRAGT